MLNKNLLDNYKGKNRNTVIETVEIIHEETDTNITLCKYQQDLELTTEEGLLKTFKPSNFVIQLPAYEENANLNITIAFAAVGFAEIRQLEYILRNSREKIKVKYRLYLENSFSYPQTRTPFVFSISSVDINNKNITFNGSLLLSVQTNIPSIDYTLENFRGLKYL